MKKSRICFVVGAICILTASIEVSAMRCKGGLVAIGVTKYEVIAKCGKPALQDSRDIHRIMKIGDAQFTKQTVTIDEWTYDMGPQSFIRVLTFEDGVLKNISRGTYGRKTKNVTNYSKGQRHIQRGDSKYEVLVKLGQPVFKDSNNVEERIQNEDGKIEVRQVIVETWTYKLGNGSLLRSVVFRNGRVSTIDVGSSPRAN